MFTDTKSRKPNLAEPWSWWSVYITKKI